MKETGSLRQEGEAAGIMGEAFKAEIRVKEKKK